ncbi:MAG: hypothetical protein IPK98_19820 [Chloracidobacterium sp.]|nr:hypothetical protein [Chloracidobacterium sp.]
MGQYDNVVAVILGGGAGSRRFPTGDTGAFETGCAAGGTYRLIDVPVSNCINSRSRRDLVLTQYNSASLNRHITHIPLFQFLDGFVEVLAAEQTKR